MIKKLTALCLMLAMCFSLAACGGGEAPQTGTDTQNTQAGEHPEYVYAAEFETFMKDSKMYFYPPALAFCPFFCYNWFISLKEMSR